jgi:peptidoglycan biosynthesis protein MviN/MurJ (putative lipid II flippase)
MMGYTVNRFLGVDDQRRGWLYLGIALLAIGVFFVGHWALATYYPMDYGTQDVVLLVMLALAVLGVYAAFRINQLRHPQ